MGRGARTARSNVEPSRECGFHFPADERGPVRVRDVGFRTAPGPPSPCQRRTPAWDFPFKRDRLERLVVKDLRRPRYVCSPTATPFVGAALLQPGGGVH